MELNLTQTEVSREPDAAGISPPLKVFQMDLWTIVPYYASYLCEALRAEGLDVTLGSITYHLDPMCFRRHGLSNDPGLMDAVGKLRIRSAVLRRGLKFVESCLNLAALAVRFRFRRPDILHVQFLQMMEWLIPLDLWLCQYARKKGSKLICTVHNVLPHIPVPGAERQHGNYSRLYRSADALICHTLESRRLLMEHFGLDSKRIWVIPHGPMFHDMSRPARLDARKRHGYAPSECVVLTQGFIAPYKGINFLLDSWALVQRQHPDARLVVAGSGQQRWLTELQAKVRALGLESSVRLEFRFIPAEELPALYQAADILVYPYSEITGSGALMTGLTFRKPIVATDLKAFREVLTNNESALLTPYGDIQSFAAALSRLIGDPALRNRLAANAACNLDSWPRIARKTRQCYESLFLQQADSRGQESRSDALT